MVATTIEMIMMKIVELVGTGMKMTTTMIRVIAAEGVTRIMISKTRVMVAEAVMKRTRIIIVAAATAEEDVMKKTTRMNTVAAT